MILSIKNKISLCLVCLCFLLVVLGCNIYRDFVIVNNSNEILAIEYDLLYIKVGDSSPNIMSIQEFDSGKHEWRNIDQSNNYTIDKENKKISLKLYPNQAFRINTVDVEKLERYPDETIRIKYLKITGENGEIKLQGNQVFKNFKQEIRDWSLLETNYPTYIYYYQ